MFHIHILLRLGMKGATLYHVMRIFCFIRNSSVFIDVYSFQQWEEVNGFQWMDIRPLWNMWNRSYVTMVENSCDNERLKSRHVVFLFMVIVLMNIRKEFHLNITMIIDIERPHLNISGCEHMNLQEIQSVKDIKGKLKK